MTRQFSTAESDSDKGIRRAEIPVDLKAIMAGMSQDVARKQHDILFVARSGGKKAALRAAEAAVQIGTAIAILQR